ncbi:VOC family protein [Micromonospora avicenniae]|uniref:Glyoxalase/Bleomycin resistance protein/Dioxygenase superfamily protein n=1 Tax=Micromonospora avicenniae TaxID=1198245 RepID=A0A1N7EA40_9ACTN|nr:VOC family protein [Micromonospora avicenniae]SIR85003.1 Glyoxalase/Bleomycin resistance protein/Dioxygenase superfamily protein [Micromonospora avicenniae]
MANGGSRPIAPVRKLIAAVLGTVATFVMLFGLGMMSWAIVALGTALLVLAIALATVRAGGRTWVIGEGHVHSASEPPTQYAFGRCELQLVIDAPGLPPRSKKIIEPRVPVSKWPSLGQTLPIRVALDDQRHVRVLWDEVPTHAETAAAAADLPPEYAGTEPVDEVLIAQDAPPWAGRSADDDFRDPLGGDPLRGDPLRDDPGGPPAEREPVVVHQRPGGPVVLEGTLVEPAASSSLPRRATPAPRPPAEEDFDTVTPATTAPTTTREDPLDPLDLPLDEPTPLREPRDEHVTPAELDEAIFGGDPTDDPADPAAPISGIGLTVLVTELSRSLDFYRDVLGFTEVDQGDGNALLASGPTRLVLRQVSEAAPVSRRLVHVNLEVDDIQAAYGRLRDSGVRFTYAPRVVNRGAKFEVWAAAFRDPDGHGIALTQWRERADA